MSNPDQTPMAPARAGLESLYYDQATELCDLVYPGDDPPDSAHDFHVEVVAALADAHEEGRNEALSGLREALPPNWGLDDLTGFDPAVHGWLTPCGLLGAETDTDCDEDLCGEWGQAYLFDVIPCVLAWIEQGKHAVRELVEARAELALLAEIPGLFADVLPVSAEGTTRERIEALVHKAVTDRRDARAECDRLARVLAVEQGDASQAPRGWHRHGPDDWRTCSSCERVHKHFTGKNTGKWAWELGGPPPWPAGVCNSALEAMEAADAAKASEVTP